MGIHAWLNSTPQERQKYVNENWKFTQGTRDIFREVHCEYMRKNNSRKNADGTIPLFEEYCLEFEARLARVKREKLEDSKEANAKNSTHTNKEAHDQCRNAADYEGCMNYQEGK